MKKFISVLLILLFFKTYSQNKKLPYTFGEISSKEIKMTKYTKDTTANAVVLYEHGNVTIEESTSYFYLKKTVYRKIKILNNDGKEHATIKIYIYNDKNKSKEKVKRIKALTYNINEPNTFLNEAHVFTNTINENWKEVTFTFPNVKPGSVLEYQYDFESRFFYNFKGWSFQSDIPKIHSEFHAVIPGFWRYNRHLSGTLKLIKNDAKLISDCFRLDSRNIADCEDITYAMKDIPSFIENEKYSTSAKNYISKIKFELAEVFHSDGTNKKYTTTWKETDRILKTDESIGRQINNTSFFNKNIPIDILSINEELNKTKSIYKYIQNHFNLNKDKHYIFKNVDIKDAYKKNLGSASEINLALISALKSVDINAKILMLSTRDNGFPTKLHPVMTDFNYIIAHVIIQDKIYLLDASDKLLSFNMIPFKCLNSYGRVLDFKNGSYWHNISPTITSTNYKKIHLNLDEEGLLSGILKEYSSGYLSKEKRKNIVSKSKEKYIEYLESENPNLEISKYKNSNLLELDNKLEEEFEIKIEASESIGNMVYINPFIDKYNSNPFQLNKRNYPIDFGYKLSETYMAEIEIPDSYTLKSTHKDIALSLPNNGGIFIARIKKTSNKFLIYTKINLNKTIYQPEEYPYLKEFFNQIIKTQNSLITLEKTNIN